MRKGLIIVCLFLFSCQSANDSKSMVSKDKMKVIVWQLMQADEYYTRNSLVDSTWRTGRKNVEFYQQIFDLNKVSREQFYATMSYLEKHPIEFKVFMDSVNEFSKREKTDTIVAQ